MMIINDRVFNENSGPDGSESGICLNMGEKAL